MCRGLFGYSYTAYLVIHKEPIWLGIQAFDYGYSGIWLGIQGIMSGAYIVDREYGYQYRLMVISSNNMVRNTGHMVHGPISFTGHILHGYTSYMDHGPLKYMSWGFIVQKDGR